MKNLLLIAVTILLAGCGKKESVVEVKPEEPVAESKSTEEAPVNPNLKYEIKGAEVIITGLFYKKYCFNISSL